MTATPNTQLAFLQILKICSLLTDFRVADKNKEVQKGTQPKSGRRFLKQYANLGNQPSQKKNFKSTDLPLFEA
jgi:putative alpha-1,2-mannosidase